MLSEGGRPSRNTPVPFGVPKLLKGVSTENSLERQMWVVKTRGPSTAWFDPTKRDRTTALRMTGFEWMTEFKRMTGVRRMTRTSGSAARLKGALFQKRLSAGRRECHPVRGGMGAAPPFGRLAGAPAGGASPARAGDRVREHQADQFSSPSQRTHQGRPCRAPG